MSYSLHTLTQLDTLEAAILRTVAYADIFDYPLLPAEVHRYLVRLPASLDEVRSVLASPRLARLGLQVAQGYVMLSGRDDLPALRQRRAQRAAQLWPKAIAYAHRIAALPFVRMVAVTGSLAVDNIDDEADIDFLIVTAAGRLWLARALVIGVVHWAAREDVVLCPNYLLSEKALALSKHTLFLARELTQMVPIVGLDIYERMRRLNPWTKTFLPNAEGPPRWMPPEGSVPFRSLQRAAEALLQTPVGGVLERWEMNRKVAKFRRQHPDGREATFSPDWCKGHFDGHETKTMTAFSQRIRELDEVYP